MKLFEMSDLLAQQAQSGRSYLEFLRVPSMSLGMYVLPAGSVDPQQPHNEDEVYYVVAGKGMIEVDGESRPVQPGSTVFVAAHAPHQFHSIEEDLSLLVFFAPPES